MNPLQEDGSMQKSSNCANYLEKASLELPQLVGRLWSRPVYPAAVQVGRTKVHLLPEIKS